MSKPPSLLNSARLSARPAHAQVPKSKTVYFEVFGCQMNKLDAELMLATLLDHGYTLTREIADAGVVLYNTCSVRQQSVNRVYSKLGQLRGRKAREKDLVVGFLGCVAQHEKESVLKQFPQVDIVCGTGEFLKLPALIDRVRAGERVLAVDLDGDVPFRRVTNLGPHPTQAFVSVMRGCDQACTFCIVPTTRGKEMSRPVAEIVDEVRALVDQGVLEVTLLGQTVNSYGKRLAPGRKIGFHHLLHELNKIRGLERIRFITSHPRFMTQELIDAMGDLERVCEYLHLPVQSGSDAVLKRMLRTYTLDHYRDVIARCREKIRGFAVATDFIVGFPGESDAEFEESCKLLEEIRFQGSFVFKYSPREGTKAALEPDDVPEDVKRERNQTLLKLQQRIAREIYRERIGRVEEVLVEGPSRSDPDRLTGRNRAQQIVVFPRKIGSGPVVDDLVGQIVGVRITEATAVTLIGERVGEPKTLENTVRAGSFLPIEELGLLRPVGLDACGHE